MCDRRGRALAFHLVPGQASELRVAPILLAAVQTLGTLGRVVADRGYSSAAWRSLIQAAGAEAVVPANPTHPPVVYDRAAYRRRHRIENLWARLKEWRALATRYDKTAASYLGGLHLAAALDWLSYKP